MTNIQQAGLNTKNATTLKPSELHFGIDWSFKMRYCMTFYSPENLAPGIVQKSGLIVQTPSYNSLDPYSYNNPDMFQ